ncbi:MAG: hypothetical protein GY797_04665 [Deltaproteobacteria bacterium]|nr:hypothetical protein [Deltaproteobacteria bacterium]
MNGSYLKTIYQTIKSWVQEIDSDQVLEVTKITLSVIGILAIVLVILAIIIALITTPFLVIGFIIKIAYEFISNIHIRYYYASGAVVLCILLLLFFKRIGAVSLSSQSTRYRGKVLLCLFLLFLIEQYDLNLPELFRLATTNPLASEKLADATKGLLGCLTVYFFIEFFYNYLSDYMKSKHDSKDVALASLSAVLAVFVGAFRCTFDIILPIFACVFVSSVYLGDIHTFAKDSGSYVRKEIKSEYEGTLENHETIQAIVHDVAKKTDEIGGLLSDVAEEVKDFMVKQYWRIRKRIHHDNHYE